VPTGIDCHDRSGGLVGGQIGYRWQLPNNHFVWGLEAQGDWANLSSSHNSLLFPALTLGAKVDGIGLFTGQWGFAWDTWLWYVKGGFAVTDNNFFISDIGFGVVSASTTRWGGVIGTRIEYAFSPNWSVGFEYDHLFMSGRDIIFPGSWIPRLSRTWSPFASTTALVVMATAARSSPVIDFLQSVADKSPGMVRGFFF
jgi:outer membrane immunogenic protein